VVTIYLFYFIFYFIDLKERKELEGKRECLRKEHEELKSEIENLMKTKDGIIVKY